MCQSWVFGLISPLRQPSLEAKEKNQEPNVFFDFPVLLRISSRPPFGMQRWGRNVLNNLLDERMYTCDLHQALEITGLDDLLLDRSKICLKLRGPRVAMST